MAKKGSQEKEKLEEEYQSQKELINKYRNRLEEELGTNVKTDTGVPDNELDGRVISKEYKEFKKTFLPEHLTLYEKACQISEKVLKIRPDEERAKDINEAIEITHLNVSPAGTLSFSFLAPLILMILGTSLSFLLFNSLFLAGVFVVGSLVIIYPLQRLPDFFANNWRLKSSNQMIQCVFYIVTYMRHTSNLERAIEFSSNHVGPPLSLDLKKVLWDVESGKYGTIKESLDIYLETWRDWNKEFIEAFHLIESSLYEPSESRRLDVLDKSLSVILDETKQKMMHYAHNLQSPITMLHMMGVILPILGLVVLPLVVSFMAGESMTPGRIALYIASIYNFILPLGVYTVARVVLTKRPTGYGNTDITEENPKLKKYKNIIINFLGKEIKINPLYVSITIGTILFGIGIAPIILYYTTPTGWDISLGFGFKFLNYVCATGNSCDPSAQVGPFGVGAGILSLFITLAFGVGLGSYFNFRSSNVYEIREETKEIEEEFSSALFQLGNRLGDGIPAEQAFGKVAKVMEGTKSGEFFSIVNKNITKLGMGLNEAIFNEDTGALSYYPSHIIKSSMQVLSESIKKGPKIASQALVSMSRYIKEMHRVDERLRDLLADIISSMKGQIKFLTPAIAGIVVGISSMITNILNKLSGRLGQVAGEGGAAGSVGAGAGGAGGISNMISMFGAGLPVYYFQIIVGLYVVQITYILTVLSNGVENGSDKLNERYLAGKNLLNAAFLYCGVTLIVMLLFNFISNQIIAGTLG